MLRLVLVRRTVPAPGEVVPVQPAGVQMLQALERGAQGCGRLVAQVQCRRLHRRLSPVRGLSPWPAHSRPSAACLIASELGTQALFRPDSKGRGTAQGQCALSLEHICTYESAKCLQTEIAGAGLPSEGCCCAGVVVPGAGCCLDWTGSFSGISVCPFGAQVMEAKPVLRAPPKPLMGDLGGRKEPPKPAKGVLPGVNCPLCCLPGPAGCSDDGSACSGLPARSIGPDAASSSTAKWPTNGSCCGMSASESSTARLLSPTSLAVFSFALPLHVSLFPRSSHALAIELLSSGLRLPVEGGAGAGRLALSAAASGCALSGRFLAGRAAMAADAVARCCAPLPAAATAAASAVAAASKSEPLHWKQNKRIGLL